MPKNDTTTAELAKLATALYRAEQRVKRAQEKMRPLKEQADALEAQLLSAMMAAKIESVATKVTTVSIKRNTFAELYDDRAFFGYVARNDAWDLVRKQPVIAACRARWEDKLTVPGVRPGERADLSVTARSK